MYVVLCTVQQYITVRTIAVLTNLDEKKNGIINLVG